MLEPRWRMPASSRWSTVRAMRPGDASTADAAAPSAHALGGWLAEAGGIGAFGGMVCWFLDKTLLGFFAPGGYGVVFFFAAGIAVACVAVLVGAVLRVQA